MLVRLHMTLPLCLSDFISYYSLLTILKPFCSCDHLIDLAFSLYEPLFPRKLHISPLWKSPAPLDPLHSLKTAKAPQSCCLSLALFFLRAYQQRNTIKFIYFVYYPFFPTRTWVGKHFLLLSILDSAGMCSPLQWLNCCWILKSYTIGKHDWPWLCYNKTSFTEQAASKIWPKDCCPSLYYSVHSERKDCCLSPCYNHSS